jgi:hypothetical protein
MLAAVGEMIGVQVLDESGVSILFHPDGPSPALSVSTEMLLLCTTGIWSLDLCNDSSLLIGGGTQKLEITLCPGVGDLGNSSSTRLGA